MREYNNIQNYFFFGEVSPKTKGLVGSNLLQSALSECKGFIPIPTGGITRCPGTFYSHSDSYEQTGGKCRLEIVKVEDAIDKYYILKIYAGKISAFTLTTDNITHQIKALLFNSEAHTNNIISVATDYTESEIDDLSIAVNKGKVYIAHQEHQLMMYDFEGSTDSQIKINSYSLIMKGIDFNTTRNYPSIVAFKSGRMVLSSTLNKPNTVWLSRTPDVSALDTETSHIDVVDRYTDFTLFDFSVTKIKTEKGGSFINNVGTTIEIITKTVTYSTGADTEIEKKVVVINKEFATETNPSKIIRTTTKTTQISTGSTEANLEIDSIIEEITTKTTENGEDTTKFKYNDLSEYNIPAITINSTENTEEIRKTIDNSHAIEVQESDLAGTRVKWVSPAGKMTFATSNALFITNGQVPAPSTFDLTIGAYVTTGSKKYKTIRNYTLFAGKDNKTLYLAYYDYNTEGLLVTEISINARHLLDSGIKDFTIMFDPFPIVWVINGAGQLCSATLNFSEGRIIVGWGVQNTSEGRIYKSLAIAGGNFDTLLLYVKTGSNLHDFETLKIEEDYTLDNFIFSDRTKIQSFENWNPSSSSISVSNFNNGEEVDLILNNKYIGAFTVSNGEIFFPVQIELSGNVIARIGLTRTSYLQFFDPILSANGNALLTSHKITEVFLKVYNSGTCLLKDEKSQTEINYAKYGITKTNNDILLLSKDVQVNYPTTVTYKNDRQLNLEVDKPFPFTLLAISYKYTIME